MWTDDEELSVGFCFNLSKVDQNKIMSLRLYYSLQFLLPKYLNEMAVTNRVVVTLLRLF